MRISFLAQQSARQAFCLVPETSFALLVEQFLAHHFNLAVVMDEGIPLGVISEREVLRAWADGIDPLTPAASLMQSPVLAVSGALPWREAYREMVVRSAAYLVITQPATSHVAVLSELELCRFLGASLLAPAQTLEAFLRRNVPQVSLQSSLAEVAKMLSRDGTDGVVVVEGGQAMGLLTSNDLMRQLLRHADPENTRVASIPVPPLTSIDVNASLPEAFRAMLSFGVDHLVVTDPTQGVVGLLGAQEIEGLLEGRHIRELHVRHQADVVALQESEARRLAILDCTQIFLGLIDREGCVIEANAAALQIIGASAADVIGVPFAQTPWWSHDGKLQERVTQAIARGLAGECDGFEATHPGPDGRPVPVDFRLQPICDAAGQVRYLLAEGVDISRHKQSQEALFACSQHYEALLKATPVGVLEANVAAECVFVNPTYEAITGRSFAQVSGRQWLEGIHPDDRVRVLAAIEETRQGEEHALEYRHVLPNQQIRWVLGQSAPLFSSGGEVTGAIATLSNITERKEREDFLRLMGEALKQSSKAIALTDDEDRFRYVNAAFSRLFGYESNEIIGQSSAILAESAGHAGLDPSQVLEIVRFKKSYQGEVWRKGKDGQAIPVLLDVAQVAIQEDRPDWHISTYTDLTEIRRQLERLDRQAHYDALTLLPNRVLLEKRLELELAHARRSKKLLALLFVDLDHFKQVNDTLGHRHGDLLLQEVARRLKQCVRESDTVARMGGDEFVILAPNLVRRQSAAGIAHKILKVFESPFLLDGRQIFSGASIGIAFFPEHARQGEELFASSDAAMYSAKARGRGTFVFAGD